MLRLGHLPIDEGPMPPYRAVLFEMFDTLVNFDHAPTVEAVLRTYGLQDTFDVVIVSADVGWRKPRPEIFEQAFRRMGLDPAEAVFVGDTPEVDVAGAQAVWMHVIWLDHGVKPLPPGLASPTHTVSRLEEVLDVL